LPPTLALIFLVACTRSRVDECSDGATCYAQAQALVKKNHQEIAPKDESAKAKSADRAARALALFQRGCDLGSGISCDMLGSWLEDGDIVPPDLPRAVRLYERGCALREVRACDDLSNRYHDGRGVPKDPAMESKYRKLACALAPPMTEGTFCKE
jgi:TPR repeat protein